MTRLAILRDGVTILALLAGLGCASSTHQSELHSVEQRNLTAGIVQREIHKGMDQGAGAEALGSPNIVSRDKEGRETWIYDKIASEVSYSRSEGYGTLLLIGISKDRGAAASTQKTLTIVIKFDDSQLVDRFSYHASTF